MNIGLCAVFLEEDIWEKFLCKAIFPYKVEVIECNSAQALLPILELKQFSLILVVLNGVAGLEAVRILREKSPEVPLLWISDEDFSLASYEYRATYFLHRPVTDTQMRVAVAACLGIGPRTRLVKRKKEPSW